MTEETAAFARTDGRPLGYLELLRENREFRRLWLGQIVSQTGDWFDTIALFQLALHLTNSGKVAALILTVRFLSTVVASPLAGVIADRFNRKTIMLVADLSRVAIVLGFLLVRRPQDVWLIYVLTFLQLVASTFYEPARSAAIPSVVAPQDLARANAITSATWSAILTLGAAIGGLTTAFLGTDAAFIIDSLTFLLSAALIYGLRLPKRPPRLVRKLTLARLTGISDLREGLSYVWQRPRVFAALLAKPAWGVSGGVLVLLAIFGEQVFPVAGSGALGIAVLYIVRGFGTAVSPILLRNFITLSKRNLENTIGISFFIGGIFFALFGATSYYPLALILLFIGYMGGSLVWVNATLLLQMGTEDEYRGRVFATELVLLTMMLAISSYATGELLERFSFTPQTVAIWLGIVSALPGVVWFATRPLWSKEM